MFIFVYINIYICIIMSLIISHIFIGRYIRNYDYKIEHYEKALQSFLHQAERTDHWKLSKLQMRRLRKPQVLEAFYHVSLKIDRKELRRFWEENINELLKLGRGMRNKSMRAYYAFILGEMKPQGTLADKLSTLVMDYIKKDTSIFCRENSLKALYSMGNEKCISEAFEYLSHKGIYHSEKLLTDGLLSFQGDFSRLSEILVKNFQRYGKCFRVAIISFLFYRNEHGYDEYFVNYLQQDISMDEKCGCIRLIGKVSSERNERLLINTLEYYKDKEDWEPAAVAATALGSYVDEKALDILERAVTSPNWYVRINSAKALVKTDIAVANVRRIMAGEDKYAKDALKYAISS